MYTIENSGLQDRVFIRNRFGDPESIADAVNGAECAKLVALANAAPNLLEACHKLSMVAEEVTAGKYSQDVVNWAQEIVSFAREAIAKAEGGAQ